MIEYKWRIDPLMVGTNINGLENVVVKVTWICEATDGEFQSATSGYVPIELDPDGTFKPYEELTEADIWSWINPHIDKAIVEEGLAAVIEGQKHPEYLYLPTPWSQA